MASLTERVKLFEAALLALAVVLVPLVHSWGGSGASAGILSLVVFVNVGSTISAVKLLRREPESREKP